jgi:hypothetical protein
MEFLIAFEVDLVLGSFDELKANRLGHFNKANLIRRRPLVVIMHCLTI